MGTLLTSGTSVSYSPTWVTSRVGTRCDYRGRDECGRGSRQPSAGCTRRSHASRKPPVGFHVAEDKRGNPYVASTVLCIPMGTPVTHQSATRASWFKPGRSRPGPSHLLPAACCLLCLQAPGGNACVCLGSRASYMSCRV